MEDTKAAGTQNYELMLVANVDRADQLLARVEKSLKELNGNSVKVERLGKKALAYEIRKQADATYFRINFAIETESIKPFSDKLRLEQEDLLRYLLIKAHKVSGKKGLKAGTKSLEVGGEGDKEAKLVKEPKVTVVTKAAVSAKVKLVKSQKVRKVRKVAKEAKVSKVKKVTRGKKTKK